MNQTLSTHTPNCTAQSRQESDFPVFPPPSFFPLFFFLEPVCLALLSLFPLLHFPNTQENRGLDFHGSIDTDPSLTRVRSRTLLISSHTHTQTVAYLQSNSWKTKKDLSWIYSPPILDKFPTFSFASQTRPNRKI